MSTGVVKALTRIRLEDSACLEEEKEREEQQTSPARGARTFVDRGFPERVRKCPSASLCNSFGIHDSATNVNAEKVKSAREIAVGKHQTKLASGMNYR